VRDALLRLEVERLVSVLPRRGYRIAPISINDARELLEFRSVVEQACAVKAAELASETDLRKLDLFRDLPAKATEDNFVPYNRAFHEAITGLSGNRRMAEYSRDLVEQYDRLVSVSISMTPPRDYDEFLREHCDIIDALQARDGRRAARLVGAHIERGEKRIIAMLARAQIVP
jgi:DNA-binding GntR family transcriptional regulator